MKKLSIFTVIASLIFTTVLTSCEKYDLEPCYTCGDGTGNTSPDGIWYAYDDPIPGAYKLVDSSGYQVFEKDNWGQPVSYYAIRIAQGSRRSWAIFENGEVYPGKETEIRRYFNANPGHYLTVEVESHGNGMPWGMFKNSALIVHHATSFYEL